MDLASTPHLKTRANALLKLNSNDTYFGLALGLNVNWEERGYVDFENMRVSLDAIALIDIVSNPTDATLSGLKELQGNVESDTFLGCDADFTRQEVSKLPGCLFMRVELLWIHSCPS